MEVSRKVIGSGDAFLIHPFLEPLNREVIHQARTLVNVAVVIDERINSKNYSDSLSFFAVLLSLTLDGFD